MKRALLAALALSASTLVVVAGPAGASDYCDGIDDNVKPTYVNSSVSPTAVVIGKIKRTIKVSVRATDDCAVTAINVTLTPKGNSSAGSIYLYDFTLAAGSPLDGWWTATTVVSDYETGGTWVPSEIELRDQNYNQSTRLYGAGALQIRHFTTTTLKKPKTSVKKNKTVTLAGNIDIAGGIGTIKAKLQSRVPGKKWVTVKTVTGNYFGDYTTKVKVKTKEYRVVHLQDAVTTASVSKTYKVKKK